MLLHTFYDESLAQASYVVGCQSSGEALVIDPNRSLDQYIELTEQKDLHITAVAETHIHADFVSGSRELAQRTGAQLYLSDMGQYTYASEAGAILLKDNDTFAIGNILIQALHTPGHTPEHLSFLVTDTTRADEPLGLFSGDFLFVGDVGRPDLLERTAGVEGAMKQGVHQLFRSIQQVRDLADYLQVWPGHGAGSACGRSLGAIPQTTIGYERRFNWAFRIDTEDTFMQEILAGQPDPPVYFAQMKQVNKDGPALLGEQSMPPLETIEQLQEQLNRHVRVVDTRSADAYAIGHIPGTINIPFHDAFVTWAGWLLSYERPFVLIADQEDLIRAQRELSLIGLEHITGYLPVSAIQQWEASGKALEHVQKAEVSSLHASIKQENILVLDVRSASEYETGHLEGARNIPLGYLEKRLQEVPKEQEVVVHCQSGSRSAIAASILTAHGFKQHIDMIGGFAAWEKAGLPVVKEHLPTTHH